MQRLPLTFCQAVPYNLTPDNVSPVSLLQEEIVVEVRASQQPVAQLLSFS